MLIESVAVIQAGKWLLTQAGLALYEALKQRLLENMGMSAKQLTLPDEKALLDTYFQQFRETLAQKIIDRLDEDRLVKLNSAISQLRMASRLSSHKQGYLDNAASKFFDIASLPDPGTTAGIPNAQLRSLANLGIAVIQIEMDEVAAEKLAAGILADIPTAKKWFGDSLVQKFLEQNPDLVSSVPALQLPAPYFVQPGIQQKIIPAQQSSQTTTNLEQRTTSSPPHSFSTRPEAFVTPRIFNGNAGAVNCVAFSPDGHSLASGSNDFTIKLWNVQTGQVLRTLEGIGTNYFPHVAFSPDGLTLAFSSLWKGTISLLNAQTGQLLGSLVGHKDFVESLAFSSDGRSLASGSADKTIKLWNMQTRQVLRTMKGHTGKVTSVAFSSDGYRLASGSEDHTIKLWNAQTGQLLNTLPGDNSSVDYVAFSPDGYWLARGGWNNTIKLWNVRSGLPPSTLKGHTDTVAALTFSPDGTSLASGSNDKTIKLWNVQSGQLLRTLKGHTDTVAALTFSPDGTSLASGSNDHSIIIWG